MTDPSSRTNTRARIIEVAARILQQDGPAALTTRGVAEGAGVQAPTIYRLFGDKEGMLEAVAEHVMLTFVAEKAAVVEAAVEDGVDPLVDLRRGWMAQVEFGLDSPSLFRLLSDPDRALASAAAQSGLNVLRARVRRVAEAGLLRVSEERAVGLIQASGIGTIQTLLARPAEERDPGLADAMYESMLREILIDEPERAENGPLAAAVAFRAIASELDALTATERTLLVEWLDRVIAPSTRSFHSD